MTQQQFEENRDKILNDFFDQLVLTHVAQVLNALILFEAITNAETTKIFNDKAVQAQYMFIRFTMEMGIYSPKKSLYDNT